jgi:hypothetical protein
VMCVVQDAIYQQDSRLLKNTLVEDHLEESSIEGHFQVYVGGMMSR